MFIPHNYLANNVIVTITLFICNNTFTLYSNR